MAKQYSAEFKMESVKRVEATGGPVAKVAADLGVNENTLHGWLKRYREKPILPFPGSGKLSPDDDQVRKLEREIRELREENEILREEPEIKRFEFIELTAVNTGYSNSTQPKDGQRYNLPVDRRRLAICGCRNGFMWPKNSWFIYGRTNDQRACNKCTGEHIQACQATARCIDSF